MVTQDVTFTFVNGKLTGSNGVTSTTVEAKGNPLLHVYPKLPVRIALKIEFENSLELAFSCTTTTQLPSTQHQRLYSDEYLDIDWQFEMSDKQCKIVSQQVHSKIL